MKKFKKDFINYYALIVMVIYILNNIVLVGLKIRGPLFVVFMFVFAILNGIILIKYKQKIEYKDLVIGTSFILLLFAKNIYHFLFAVSHIVILMMIDFSENKITKIITICIFGFVVIFWFPILFALIFAFGLDLTEERGESKIYKDMHYRCEKDYEIYSYSAGAMDSTHFNIGKHYEILNIDDIITISYTGHHEKTSEEFEEILNQYHCELVGEKNGTK